MSQDNSNASCGNPPPFHIVKMRRIKGSGRKVAAATIETPIGVVWLDYVEPAGDSPGFLAPASINGRRTWTISDAFSEAVRPIIEQFVAEGLISYVAPEVEPESNGGQLGR